MARAAKILPFLLCCFISGIALASFLPSVAVIHYELYFFAAAIGFSIAAVFVSWFAKDKVLLLMLMFSFASLFLGLWRYSLNEGRLHALSVRKLIGKEQLMEVSIDQEPQIMKGKIKAFATSVKTKDAVFTGRILIQLYSKEALAYGDTMHLRCRLEAPEPIEDFRYDRFLEKDDVVAVCRQGKILSIAKSGKDLFRTFFSHMLVIKAWSRERLLAELPYDEGSLLAGIMLGDSYIMSEELKTAYSNSGMSHIVAISGMNMTLIAVFLLWLFVRLGLWRRQASAAAVATIWMYTALVGFSSSAVRASIMSTAVLIAYASGRLASADRLLALTAALMLAVNPRLLRDDLGFVLSFSAFLGLLWYYEPIRSFMARFIKWKYAAIPLEIFSLTLSAQVLALPIIAMSFGQISWVSLGSNLFVLWAIGPLMIFTAAGLALQVFIANQIVLAPAWFLAYWLNLNAAFFGQPWGSINLNANVLYLSLGYYFCILMMTMYAKFRKNDEDQDSAIKT